MVPKIYHFHNLPPFCQFYKKVVLRLSAHDDDIETQTIICIWPLKDLQKTWSLMQTMQFISYLDEKEINVIIIVWLERGANQVIWWDPKHVCLDKDNDSYHIKFKRAGIGSNSWDSMTYLKVINIYMALCWLRVKRKRSLFRFTFFQHFYKLKVKEHSRFNIFHIASP